ncbi:MAG: hypothetical protein H6619_04970 [Deltaproteobacteria bacterium]|nr:hypothetical protein [Deltaproteobacteria bacterium]
MKTKQIFPQILLIICLLLSAQPAFGIGKKKLAKIIARDSIKSKLEITNTSTGRFFPSSVKPFYNEITQEFTFTGKLTKIPTIVNKKDLKIFVDGREFSAGKVIGQIQLKKPSKNGSKYYGKGKFSAVLKIPVVPQWPILDVLIELVHTKTDLVIARDTISLYDLRFEQNANPQTPLDTQPEGMTVQLSDVGLGGLGALNTDNPAGLEVPLLESLPYPSLTDFNQKLSQAALVLPEKKVEELENCIDYADLTEDRFKNPLQFGPYATALAEAVANKQLYDFLQNNIAQCAAYFGPLGVGGCQAGLAAWCVKTNPTANDFRLCVSTVKEESAGLQMPAVKDVDLNFLASQSAGGVIQAQIDFNGYQGEVDGYLRDLSVRWKTSNCILPPVAEVPNELIVQPDKDWLESWTSCPGMTADASLATTRTSSSDSALYSVKRAPIDLEALEITDARLPNFVYSGLSTDSSVGTCGLNFINSPVNFLLNQFHPLFQTVLDNEWGDGTPYSPTSQALNALFTPFNLGQAEEPNHRLTARISSVNSAPVAGLKVGYTNFSEPIDADDFKNLNATYFSQGSGDHYDGSLGLDPDDQLFDLNYEVTVGLLNNVLHTRGSTSELNFQFIPTQTEQFQAGITALNGGGFGGGGLGTSILTGDKLSNLNPAFAEIGSKQIEIFVSRVLDPAAFMLTDPVPSVANLDGIKMAYGLNSLIVTFKEPDVVDSNGNVSKTGKVWAVFKGGFIDDDFSLSHNSLIGSQTLAPSWGNPVFYLNLATSQFKKCPKFTHNIAVDQTESCERLLETAVTNFLKIRLEPIAADLLSDIPAPQFFDGVGASEIAVQTNPLSKLQLNQRLNNFSTFMSVN